MPWSHDPHVQSLRLKYNAALAAHQTCARALTEARQTAGRPAATIVENEARARGDLERAQESLFAAMAAIVTGQKPAGGAASPLTAGHTCDRIGPPRTVGDESGGSRVTHIYSTCSVCGVPQGFESK